MTILQNKKQAAIYSGDIIVVAENKEIARFGEYPAYIITEKRTGWEISNLSQHASLPQACISEIISLPHEKWGWKDDKDKEIEKIINRYQLDWYRN